MEFHKWQDEHEDLLREWLIQACYEKLMHSHASVFYTKVYHWGGGVSVGLAAVTSAAVFFQFSQLFGDTVWGYIIVALLSLASAVMSASMQFLNPLSLATSHNRAENLYGSFVTEVSSVLCFNRDQREKVDIFMARVKTEMKLLPLSCPPIPTSISKHYVKNVTNKKPALGDIIIADNSGSHDDVVLDIRHDTIAQQSHEIEESVKKEVQETGQHEALFKYIAEKSNILDPNLHQ